MPKTIRVCAGRTCSTRGSERIMETLKQHVAAFSGEAPETFDLDCCSCTGYCEQGVNVVVDDKIYHESKPKTILERISRDEGIILKPLNENQINEFLNEGLT